MALYSGEMGSLNPNAPPSFRRGDFAFNPANGFTDPSGNQIGSANPYWSTNFGGMDSNNWRFYGGGGSDPNQFSLQYKTGPSSGMVYDYTLQGDQWMPTNGREALMGGNTQYGSDFWIPFLGMAGMAGAGIAGVAGAGAGASGSAEALGAGAAPGEAAGGFTGSATGGGAAGGGAAAGGAAAGGGGSGSGTGSLLGNMTAGDWVKLGTMGYGLLNGGNSGQGGSAGGGLLGYSGAPMRSLADIRGAAPAFRQPQTLPIDPRQSAADIWRQYSGGLLGPQPAPQPTPYQGIGMVGRPAQRTPPMSDLPPMLGSPRPPNRTGGY